MPTERFITTTEEIQRYETETENPQTGDFTG